MKAKLLMVVCSFALLTGCCSNGCTAFDNCSSSRCGGCDVGYWSTTCPQPNTGGASEAEFTDIGNVCNGSACSSDYYAGCGSSGCNSGMNW